MAVKNLDIIQVAVEQLEKKEPEMIKSMLIQFLKTNLRVPKAKKINMFDFVATGDEANARPRLSGVFMDKENKVAVATDGHTIIVSKSEYHPTKFKNGIIGKDGKNVEGKYVTYRSAMELDEAMEVVPLPIEDIIDSTLNVVAEFKLAGYDIAGGVRISGDKSIDLYFPIYRLPLLFEVGLEGWVYSPKKHCFYYKDGDKEVLVMGILINE